MNNHLQYKNILKEFSPSKLSLVFILISTIGLLYYTLKFPIQTWDLLGYIASVVSLESSDIGYIHEQVYQQLTSYATSTEYLDLTEGNHYRTVMLKDADAFYQQMPFYKIRIIFVLLILALTKIGVGVYTASHIVAAVSTCAAILVFYFAYRKIIHPVFWLIVPLFFVMIDADSVARTVTADSLAFLWVALICYAFLHQKWILLLIFLITSVLIRTDLIILAASLLFYLLLTKPQLRKATFFAGITTIAAYLFVNKYAENYGWSTVFYYAIISDMTALYPAEYSLKGVTFNQYISEVVSNFAPFFYQRSALLFEALVFLQFSIIFLYQNKCSISNMTAITMKNPPLVLTFVSIIYIALHYILFPHIEPRYFVAQYMISALSLLSILSGLVLKQR